MAPGKEPASKKLVAKLPPAWIDYVTSTLKAEGETNADFLDRAVRIAFPEHAHHLPKPNPQAGPATATRPLPMDPPSKSDVARIRAFFVTHHSKRAPVKATVDAVSVLERVTEATMREAQVTMEEWGYAPEAARKAVERVVAAGVAERFRESEADTWRYRLTPSARKALEL